MKKKLPDEDVDFTNEDLDDESEGGSKGEVAGEEKLTHNAYQVLMKQLSDAQEKSKSYEEKALRAHAENENILRRSERDVANAHKYALEKFSSDLLPIVDSLELALANVPEDLNDQVASLMEGVELTLKMFNNVLEKYGVEQVNPVGKAFNSEYEQAISMQVDDSVKPNTVLAVLQKGYTLNKRLLRPALVVVSKAE